MSWPVLPQQVLPQLSAIVAPPANHANGRFKGFRDVPTDQGN